MFNHYMQDNFDRRLEFCEEMLMRFENNPGPIDKIVWSDEAIFRLDGQVNQHNCYALENPNLIQTKELASPGIILRNIITVWAEIHSSGIVGPFFFHETVSGVRYLDMLKNQFFPAFKVLNENYVLMQQDRAPAHFDRDDVRQRLNENLGSGWIGRRGYFSNWPARSPDFTVCDFFLWDTWSQRSMLQDAMIWLSSRKEFGTNLPHLILIFANGGVARPQRFNDCIQAEGHQFEHLTWKYENPNFSPLICWNKILVLAVSCEANFLLFYAYMLFP